MSPGMCTAQRFTPTETGRVTPNMLKPVAAYAYLGNSVKETRVYVGSSLLRQLCSLDLQCLPQSTNLQS